MYGVMKRHEIQVLKNAKISNFDVAKVTEVSVRTVQRVAKEPPIVDEVGTSTRVGRPSKVEAYRALIQEILAGSPDLLSLEILRRVREVGYTGGKSAIYDLIAQMRSPEKPPMVRFEGLPAEFSQHDFGCVDVTYLSGGGERIYFFASRLKYSRWSEVRIVPNQKVESLVRALLSSFDGFGGIPLVAVFDNPTTVVIGRKGDQIEWNSTFGQVALDYRFAPELCAPRRANQKGSVENLVGWVKGSFFKVRRFHDRADLEEQLREWHHEVNHERPSRATNVIPAARIEEERKRLRPLCIPPADYALRFAVMVGPTGVVEFEKIRYSMPPESIGFPATLFLYEDRVRIVARKYEVEHARYPQTGNMSFLPEHRAAMLASVSGKRGQLYFKRQQILELGADAVDFLTEIVHRHPRTWPGEVEILFDLLQKVGEVRLQDALHQAVVRRLFGAHFVVDLLSKVVA